jgi:UDP-N-acetylglucosamine 2-epimerase (non-hydrolysing)
MTKKIKIMTIVGTRPEIIRLSRVMAVLDQVTNHILVHTGQNYDWELNGIFFKELGVREPNYYLDAAGKNPAETIGNIIIQADKVLEKESPDAVLILGDTNSCLAVIPAKRRKIPIFHMEAGNRCFDMRVPEEINRRIVDHTSDINLCYSEHARRNLLAEGLPPDRIMKTGSPMKEILDYHNQSITSSDVLNRLAITPTNYFAVSLHREENVDNPIHLNNLIDAINKLAEKYGFPIIFSVHPRTRKRLEQSEQRLHKFVRELPPLGFFDYIALQKNAFCTISDSGTITEESSILGFPAITVREAQERPEGMDEGAVVMTGLNPDRILEAVEVTRTQFSDFGSCQIPLDYNVSQVSWKVVKIILSYTDYVNRNVWHKTTLSI